MMPPSLAAKFPGIKTFTGTASTNKRITVKLDITEYGIHAMTYDGENSVFVDPIDNNRSGIYSVHFKKDEIRPADELQPCAVKSGIDEHGPFGKPMNTAYSQMPKMNLSRVSNGQQRRSFRLALACSHQYAFAATGILNPTKAQVLSKMTTTMNRVNGVYEKEMSVSMVFVDHEDTLINIDSLFDPFGPDNSDASSLLTDNQIICDSLIGTDNYDIGHVFSTGGGGLSDVGVVCNSRNKARSETGGAHPVGDGFDVDYVAHEMGHEFGAEHTFNNGMDGSCAHDNRNAKTAYEPGSGSTIMAYAGICSPDDLQPHSDDYFHANSLAEMESYLIDFADVCAVKAVSGNLPPYVPVFAATYYIPILTPFQLSAPIAVDSVADESITYCWEQWDLESSSSVGLEFRLNTSTGPLFRSFYPTVFTDRVFPKLNMILAGDTSDAGHENNEGERLPYSPRQLNFKLSVRTMSAGYGCFVQPDDMIKLYAVAPGPFKVTSQNNPDDVYFGTSEQSVTWDVAYTNLPPVSTDSVDIHLSMDSARTWQYNLGRFPNNGMAVVTIPNPVTASSSCRIKVKGVGNVFFNIGIADATIIPYEESTAEMRITPIPSNDLVHIFYGNKTMHETVIYNSIGQVVFKHGEVKGQLDIPVYTWPTGVYFARVTTEGGSIQTRKIMVR
jgi:hypothetical protein